MRKIYFVLILLLGSIIMLKAQTENKGSFELGTTSSAGINFDFKKNNLNLDISPTLGYYLTDHFVIGMGMDINYRQHREFHDINYNIGLFSKYYFKRFNHIQPYVKAQLNTVSWTYPDEVSYSWGYIFNEEKYSWSIGGGLSYWLKPSVALITEINYSHTFRKNYPEYDFSNLGVKFGIIVKLDKNK